MQTLHTKPGLKVVTSLSGGETHFFRYDDYKERDTAISRWQRNKNAVDIQRCDIRTLPWRDPNHQHLNTGLKAFDSQFQCLPGGNLIANTFLGQHVRARTDTECNGFSFGYAELQNADLKAFKSLDRSGSLARAIQRYGHFENQQGWATMVFHRNGTRDKGTFVIHGAVITDRHLKLIARLDSSYFGQPSRARSYAVMDVVTPYLTDAIATNLAPVALH